MHDPSFMALALIVSEEMTSTKKLDKSQRTIKSTRRLKTECRVDLSSSRFMHDPSFMALVSVLSKELT